MNKDIKSIVVLLAAQASINLGQIADPIKGEKSVDLGKAETFIDLLDVLNIKTKGNLNNEEEAFLKDVIENLKELRLKIH